MNRRLLLFLVVLFTALCALLLLSTLVVTPEADTAATADSPIAHTITAFVSMPPVPTTSTPTVLGAWLKLAVLFSVIAALFPSLTRTCDANGRVLSKRRYVHSFHPVFKQDLACG